MSKISGFRLDGDVLIYEFPLTETETDERELPVEELGGVLPNSDGVSEAVNQLAEKTWRNINDLYELARWINRLVPNHLINWERTFEYIEEMDYLSDGATFSAKNV